MNHPVSQSRENLRIVHLVDFPQAIPVLTRWFIEEWEPFYGPEGPGDAKADLSACCRRDDLPIGLVALGMDDDVLGTAALKSSSVGGELGVGPWLAALLVGKDHQGRGVGRALVEAIEGEACRLGFGSIYTSSELDESIMGGRGWQAFGSTESLKGPITIYRRGVRQG